MHRLGRPVLGIDPSSTRMGWALFDDKGQYLRGRTIFAEGELHYRLAHIVSELEEDIRKARRYVGGRTLEIAAEATFVGRKSSLGLVHSLSAVMIAAANRGLPFDAYPIQQVRKAVLGAGRAEKWLVMRWIRKRLRLKEQLQEDVSEAALIALYHGGWYK